jgi:acetylglutamate synthase
VGHPVFLWVSTATYLPLRLIWVSGKTIQTNNWYYLPPSKASLEHLRVPIPPGYPRSR